MKRNETWSPGRPLRRIAVAPVCSAMLLILIAVAACAAQETSKSDAIIFKPKVTALFKSGLGFFVCEGEGKVGQGGEVVSSYIPEAAFGAFWLASLDPDVVLKSARAAMEEVKHPIRAASIADLLRVNAGKEVSILFGEQMIKGTILAAPDAPFEKEPSIVVLETSSGRHVALKVAEIKRVDFGKECQQTFERSDRENRLRIITETQKPTARLQMSFLQKGIAWVPSYNVDIADEQKARISMQAIVMNDAVDLEGTDLYFIVGYPNLQYSDMLSPISLQQTITQLMERYSQGAGGVARHGIMTQTAGRYMYNEAVVGDVNGDSGYSIIGYSTRAAAGLQGSREEDLFFYNLKDYSLRRGERGYVNLFSSEVDYKHIYVWSVPQTIEEKQSGSRTPSDTQTDEVWHCIKLQNSSPYPWTSGAALTTRGWKPLGQDTLRYTPKESETNLRITQVTDIKISRKEVETQRQKKSLHVLGLDWDLVSVKGELALKSYKDKPIEMEITKQLLGEVLETTDGGVVTKRAEGLQAVNPRSEIKWSMTLQPGEEKIIHYVFNIYVGY